MRKFVNYLKECAVELTKKTTWPTWQKLQASALLVLGTTVALAAVIFGVDWVFQTIMKAVYSLKH
ncbi:MAG: preprotein translocase subunit SecE [Bacteroidales bacterium]|nr:preprotein translocase subunit SecE [Bacteroidales bacterium]